MTLRRACQMNPEVDLMILMLKALDVFQIFGKL